MAEAEEHASGSENLQQRQIQPDRKEDALPVIQGEKKPYVSCWRYSNPKSMGCERPGIGLHYGLGVWDDVHLNSFLL